MHVGGAVEWLLEPASPAELAAAIAMSRAEGCVPRILGGGANLIVDDGVLPGVVITTDRMSRLFRPNEHVADDDTLQHGNDEMTARLIPLPREVGLRFVAWAGVTLPKLVRSAAQMGWKGVECLAGVPGNVGGGVAMNAGGRYGEMWDVVERLLVVDRDGNLLELARDRFQPTYRDAHLRELVVASAVLRFELDSPALVQERGRQYLLEKNAVQPVTEWSAGCVFKNPPKETSGGLSAGQLVERAGGKGRERGDAIVSPRHGNFIVNRGHASATDVLALIEDVHDLVLEKCGVDLEREVKVWRADPSQRVDDARAR